MEAIAAVLRSSADALLEDLNPLQRQAVTHGTGPLLVLAGAGTGKTSVITRRIAWLVAAKRARPSEILALTFTEKAAAEMEERVDLLVPYGYNDVTISTFHAFARRLVAEHALALGLPGEPRVLSEPESLVLLRERLFALPLERLRPLADPTRHLAALLQVVHRARDEAVSPAEYRAEALRLEAAAGDDAEREEARQQLEIAAFYQAYLDLLQREGLCDYGQLQWLALRLLEDHAGVRREAGERFRYLLVDEFQDTNLAQLRLLEALAGRERNLTVVGDDDQSIYHFRGASYANVTAFRRAFPEARLVVLRENYRSTQPLLDAAYRLVRANDPDRMEVQAGVDKRLVAVRRPAAAREPSWHLFDTASSEAEWVAAALAESAASGRALKEHAVLGRTHAILKPILQTFAYRGVPYRYAGNRGLYDAPEILLCQHVLRAVADPGDSPATFELAASALYAVPPEDLAWLSGVAARRHRSLEEVLASPPGGEAARLRPETGERVSRLLADLRRLRELAVSRGTGEVLYRFLEISGWLERLSLAAEPGAERQAQNLARFFDIARGFGDLAERDRVHAFVRHLRLLQEAGDDPPQAEAESEEDAVAVLTVHRAKGLEFPVVHVVGLVDGRFPSRQRPPALPYPQGLRREPAPSGDAHLQEERRLFFVAMTRARDALHLSASLDAGGERVGKPSRFLVEALDLPPWGGRARRPSALEAIARHAPDAAPPAPAAAPLAAHETLSLSHEQIADYQTCPAKYRFAHVLRVPLLPHHGVVYGLAVHNAIRAYYRHVLNGWPVSLADVWAAFEGSWRSEGFLSREHEESRLEAGREALRRFFEREQAAGTRPHAVEREFRFALGADRIAGRFDRIDLRREGPVIVDFKSSDVREAEAAGRRAAESLQLALYALAYREAFGTPPVATELHFVESGVVGRAAVGPDTFERALGAVRETSAGVRARRFEARPSFTACRQCAFQSVCPARYGA
jgi:DNA helicase-2/ATP-dependent DNA helicase PcrA